MVPAAARGLPRDPDGKWLAALDGIGQPPLPGGETAP